MLGFHCSPIEEARDLEQGRFAERILGISAGLKRISANDS